MIKDRLSWAPCIPIRTGLQKTYAWISGEIEKEKAAGGESSQYSSSEVVVQVTDTLDSLNTE